MPFTYSGERGIPGIRTAEITYENQVWIGAYDYNKSFFKSSVIDARSRDANNTPTTLLRAGLVLGKRGGANTDKYAGELTVWDPTATDGSEQVYGILTETLNTQRSGNDDDKYSAQVIISGYIRASAVIDPESTSGPGLVGSPNEAALRAGLSANGRFILDDQPAGAKDNGSIVTLTDGQTRQLTWADSGTLFVLENSSDLQLPATDSQKPRGFTIQILGKGPNATLSETTASSLVPTSPFTVVQDALVTITGGNDTEFNVTRETAV